tara:strand:+ start:7012 stop:7698 length:687 start_codon:yes stop_codon:yes gene_type:complete
MRILSIDVGIKNLSYVLMEIKSIRPAPSWKIIKWNNINIMHSFDDLNYVINEYQKWNKPILEDFVKKIEVPYQKRTKEQLHCEIKKYLKEKKIKKGPVNLQKMVTNIRAHFSEVISDECDAIVIENQPCMKNPQMKSVQMMVFTYFCLIPNICPVSFIPASQKMRFCKSIGWIDNMPKTYAETKKTSIQVVSKLISGTNSFECWEKATKKDDLSDVIIQAFAHCDKLV